MPLEDPVAGVEGREQRICLARLRDPDRLESQLADRCPVDTRIEGPRQHLRAQADAQHRQPGVDGAPHQVPLGQQVRIALDFVDIHLAAKNDKATDLPELGPPRLGLKGIDTNHWHPVFAQRRDRDPERVVPIIPHAEHRLHRFA